MLAPAVTATPWALPGALAVIGLSVLLNRRTALALGSSRAVALLLTTGLGAVLVVTLTPSPDAGFWGRSRTAAFELVLPTPAQLLAVNEVSLNVLLFVPLALAAALLPRGRRRAVLGVWLLPFTVEGMQYALPALGRSGFLLGDVIANLIGAAAGTVLGLVARWLWPHGPPTPVADAPRSPAREQP